MTTWNSTKYSSDDMMRMQQDAIRRVKEMQRQASMRLNETNNSSLHSDMPKSLPETNENASKEWSAQNSDNVFRAAPSQNNAHNTNRGASHAHSQGGVSGMINNLLGTNLGETVGGLSELPKKAFSSISSVLEGFGIDNERLILMVLIFLLANEKSDKTLLLALGYLLF